MRRRLIPLLAAVLVLAACANPERDKLDKGLAHAKRLFGEVSRNPISTLAFGSTLEGGGNLSGYIANNSPENADLPRFTDDRPSGPWSIALRFFGEDRVIIEGYGEKTDKPIVADTVSMRLKQRAPTP